MPGSEDRQSRERIHRLETLLQEVDQFKDPRARDKTRQIVQALMDLHSAALEAILTRVAATGDAGVALIDEMGNDELVSGLLLLYGLHPLDLNARVGQALESVRPYLHSHGGNVELLGVADGIVRIRLEGSCHGCPSSALTLKSTIEEAIYEKAPDITAIEVEGANGHSAAPAEVNGTAPAAGHRRFALPVVG